MPLLGSLFGRRSLSLHLTTGGASGQVRLISQYRLMLFLCLYTALFFYLVSRLHSCIIDNYDGRLTPQGRDGSQHSRNVCKSKTTRFFRKCRS